MPCSAIFFHALSRKYTGNAISALSPFWQNLSLINPIVYMVNAFRFGILGHSDVNVVVSLSVMTICCAVLYGIAYYLLSRGSGMRE